MESQQRLFKIIYNADVARLNGFVVLSIKISIFKSSCNLFNGNNDTASTIITVSVIEERITSVASKSERFAN